MTPAQDQRRRFFGDTRSLKSFRGSLQTSFSPKATSLKAKHHLRSIIPSVLSRGRRWTQSGDPSYINPRGGESNDTHVYPPLPELPPTPSESMPSTSQTVRPPIGVEEYNMLSRDKFQRVRNRTTRSKTIMGLISKTFRPHSPPPSPTPPTPPRPRTQITSVFASREYRDAALRERGLLPPLKPHLDLSQAERRRDSFLPVSQPPTHEEELVMNGETVKMSAASKIKQEWEATNRIVTGDEGLTSAAHGGKALSPSRPTQEVTLETPLHLTDDHCPSQPHLGSSPHKNLNSSFVSPGMGSATRSFTPSDPHLVPLPSSPLAPSLHSVHHKGGSDLDLIQPSSIPLPMSPVPSIGSSARLLLESSLIVLDTPPVSVGPVLPEGGNICEAPGTSRSASTPVILKALIATNDIPIIVESPVDERPAVLAPEVIDEVGGAAFDDQKDNELLVNPRRTRKRNMTDSAISTEPRMEHRKSFNLFKRGQNPVLNLDAPPPPEASSTKRLSVSASFSNIRRSFIGTLSPSPSRPKLPKLNFSKPNEGINVTMDPSSPPPLSPATLVGQNSPRSPMSPKSPGWSPVGYHRSSPQLASPRKAVSPTFHSTGTILVETANIEDDEMRRMTELAFLG